jgi:uncharacterized membrane protein YbhN (UPF0104 family)
LRKRALSFLPSVLGLALLGGIAFALHGALAKISAQAVVSALFDTPHGALLRAFGFTALSCLFMAFYDLPGVLFARKSVPFPWIGFRHVWFASFCAYALSHVIGAATLSGTAIRVRLYAQWGVPVAGIARIVTLIGTIFPLGMASLIGGVLLLDPRDIPLFGGAFSTLALRGFGVVLWILVGTYLVAANGKTPLVVLRREVARPGLAIAAGQVLLSCSDIATACAILYMALPPVPGLNYTQVLAIYVAGFAGAMFSGLPGGVGVLDTILLLGLSPQIPLNSALGAILLYRLLYYLLPATLGALGFAMHEIRVAVRRHNR